MPVASMATERTPCASNQSLNACSCDVTVPNTFGSSPPMETCICSMPTSTNAASGSSTGNFLDMVTLRIEIAMRAAAPSPVTSTETTNLSGGKQSSPKCANDRDRNQSAKQAIE